MDVIVLDSPWLGVERVPRREEATTSHVALFVALANERARRCGTWIGAALITALVHGLLIGSLLTGTGIKRLRPPLAEGVTVSALTGESSELVSTYVVINDHSITPAEERDDSAYAVATSTAKAVDEALLSIAIEAPQLPSISGSDDGVRDSPSDEANGNGAEAAMLFGRYMGQIKARIERAWRYPPSTSSKTFACKVQIRQSRQGDVQEVTLQRCGVDPAWQVSLVQAIQAASPLSAPPSEKVFTQIITLDLEASES
jgi:hypothetical protein